MHGKNWYVLSAIAGTWPDKLLMQVHEIFQAVNLKMIKKIVFSEVSENLCNSSHVTKPVSGVSL